MSTSKNNNEIDDLSEAVLHGRPLHPGRAFKVRVGNPNLKFKTIILNDPLPLGRQLLESVNAMPVEEHAVIAFLPNGDFEDIRLDEGYDLRGRGVEKIVVFRTDRSFKFKVDHRDLEWGMACIEGKVLKKLAKLQAGYNLFREVRGGGHDIKIEDTDIIDFDETGVERFITVIDETTEGEALLPSHDSLYLNAHNMSFEVVNDGKSTGVVLKEYQLPEGKYDHDIADILILLPPGYPDSAPDMFYASPCLKLKSTGREAYAANVSHSFGGKVWQRWSRHNRNWRSGIDGIHTMLARVQTALESARAI